ncbi:MAG: Hpt domain-containing protein [Planctomycetaceae bacterium]|jgi:HPt (histidine-containing phosphotransfer) domain-containing protein|nr:Hpt domain-containing protein [Planctomycetaceae bacterium]
MSENPQTLAPLYSILSQSPDLREIVQMFVDEMPKRINTILQEFQAKDWDNLLLTTHQLKGSAGSYGFTEISPAAGTVENLLRKQSSETEIYQAIEELIALCRRASAEGPQN